MTPVETWLSTAAFEAERDAPGASADAVVWTEVGNRAYADSELNWTYTTFMALATLIAGGRVEQKGKVFGGFRWRSGAGQPAPAEG